MNFRQLLEFLAASIFVGLIVWAYMDFVDSFPELFSIFFPSFI